MYYCCICVVKYRGGHISASEWKGLWVPFSFRCAPNPHLSRSLWNLRTFGNGAVRTQFKYWSPLPSEPEKRLPVDPDTATASCSASLARLAVTGGVHVGWKSTTTGAGIVTWQVRVYGVQNIFSLPFPLSCCDMQTIPLPRAQLVR